MFVIAKIGVRDCVALLILAEVFPSSATCGEFHAIRVRLLVCFRRVPFVREMRWHRPVASKSKQRVNMLRSDFRAPRLSVRALEASNRAKLHHLDPLDYASLFVNRDAARRSSEKRGCFL